MQNVKNIVTLSDVDIIRHCRNINIPENKDNCWEWVGYKKNGYGYITFSGSHYFAHRISYFLNTKVDPFELKVLHKCDNPGCQNPNHLFLGTQADNIKDMDQKGRRVPASGGKHGWKTKPESLPRGEKCGMSKLTEANVLDIYKIYSAGTHTNTAIGKMFGINKVNVEKIAKGVSWAHLFNNIPLVNKSKGIGDRAVGERHGRYTHPETIRRGSDSSLAKLTDEIVLKIREEYAANDIPYISLASKYNVTIGTIWKIVVGRTWKHLLPKDPVNL